MAKTPRKLVPGMPLKFRDALADLLQVGPPPKPEKKPKKRAAKKKGRAKP